MNGCLSLCSACCSPWPPLERLRGKVLVVLIVGRATSTEARALYEAFPDLSELLLLLLLYGQ